MTVTLQSIGYRICQFIGWRASDVSYADFKAARKAKEEQETEERLHRYERLDWYYNDNVQELTTFQHICNDVFTATKDADMAALLIRKKHQNYLDFFADKKIKIELRPKFIECCEMYKGEFSKNVGITAVASTFEDQQDVFFPADLKGYTKKHLPYAMDNRHGPEL